MRKEMALTVIVSFVMILSGVVQGGPPPQPSPDQKTFGSMIPRTMKKLATSTKEHRQYVNILFYGQSIVAQSWWKKIVWDLRKRFPTAKIVVRNRAIGGSRAPVLVKTFYSDVLPLYPDLVFFHDYNADNKAFEEMVRGIRKFTTAEIMLSTHHIGNQGENAKNQNDKESEVIRQLAKKYKCELIEVRNEWAAYLKRNSIKPGELTYDVIHPNAEGQKLITALIKRHFQYVPNSKNPYSDCIKVVPAKLAKDGTYKITFTGNRIDALPAASGAAGSAKVLIDGKSPKDIPELVVFTRPSEGPGVWWPAVRKIYHDVPLIPEDWTLTVTKASYTDPQSFKVEGSVTGPDGSGISTEKFVSKSKRVIIQPKTLGIAYALKFKKQPLPQNFQVTWSAIRQYVDPYTISKSKDKYTGHSVMIAQGLKGGTYTLVLKPIKGEKMPAVKSFVVYTPPLMEK